MMPDAFFYRRRRRIGIEGAKGVQLNLVGELTENYDHLFCACGTGTTAAGYY